MKAAEGDFENSAALSPKQKCVVRWAELVTKNEAKRDKKCWEEIKTHFSPQEIIELTVVICHFNLMNRLNDTLQLDLETPPPSMRSTTVAPEKLKKYAREVLAR
ncbi:MAG: hypothetical protein A3J27_12705 [Candidatus Tectomicrobia bacterium RIFCSPLOWO2_12_FULL_69_37]|nr:MAG: hypothetical protein A3I72_12460 [Candidatus Tectomicrobia bacterium RIFCSPLOWO2_02_FULL_70_19]OGL65287.1 MAG: hypothetical protein A3J27_12705 [Candidatus Tectomicrobia bacterium RIFCSPLOWO2_12_FULL_69_37]